MSKLATPEELEAARQRLLGLGAGAAPSFVEKPTDAQIIAAVTQIHTAAYWFGYATSMSTASPEAVEEHRIKSIRAMHALYKLLNVNDGLTDTDE